MTKEGYIPSAILLTDEREDSTKAKELLDKKGIEYIEKSGFVFEEGMEPPILYGTGGEFRGIKGVEAFTQIRR